MRSQLTAKQQRFIEEYPVDLNATRAAMRAGYSPKTAAVIGYENLKKDLIRAAVRRKLEESARKAGFTTNMVLKEISAIAFSNIGDLYHDWGAGPSAREIQLYKAFSEMMLFFYLAPERAEQETGKMSSEVFSQFEKAIENYRARQREAQGDLEANRARKAELLAEFDRAALEGAALAPIQARLAQLDNEYELLNRKAVALGNADKSEPFRKLAEGVVAENSAHLHCLRADFNEILEEVQACRRGYLRLISKAGDVYRKGKGLSNEINIVSESLRTRGPIVHVPGVADDLNLAQMKGSIFFDNQDIKNSFERGFDDK